MTNRNLILIVLLASARYSYVHCQFCSITEPNITASTSFLQVFTSPGYNGGAGAYTSNMNCWWIIDSGSDDLQILIFLTYDTACPGDKISIYDDNVNSASTLASDLCGTVTEPADYSTSQRYARIEMVTDGTTENAGFKLEYLAAKDHSHTGCAGTQTLRTKDTYQYLSSPNFPGTYASNSNCRWNVYNPNGRVDIDVIVSDVEKDDQAVCNYDKYQIYDGEHKCDNNVAQMVCSEFPSTSPFTYASNGTTVVVTFVSDSSVNTRGFILRYKGSDIISTNTVVTTSTTAKLKHKNDKTSTGEPLSTEVILGIIFGSLILLCFMIMTVVFVITRVSIPIQKSITPTETIQRSPSIAWSVRSRKPSKTKLSGTITQPIFISNDTSTGSSLPNGAPPRATTNMFLSYV